MPLKFAANLSLLFADQPFLERFAHARKAGFRYVEFQFPYAYESRALANALTENGLEVVLFNLPPGDWAAGERGLGALPDRIEEFRTGVRLAFETAQTLGARRLNCLAGKRDPRWSREEQYRVLIDNLRYASRVLGAAGITLVIEHLNPYDNPGFFLSTPSTALAIQEQVADPNVLVQYDIYHAQRTEGELANTLSKNLHRIGHIQIADNPGRHEPGTGEINYRFLLQELERLGYDRYIGLEYVPTGATQDSLGWVTDYNFRLGG